MCNNNKMDNLEEIKSQYDALMEMSREQFPETGEYLLHVAVIDWLNKEFNENYDNESIEIIKKMEEERFKEDTFYGLEINGLSIIETENVVCD